MPVVVNNDKFNFHIYIHCKSTSTPPPPPKRKMYIPHQQTTLDAIKSNLACKCTIVFQYTEPRSRTCQQCRIALISNL